MTNNVNDLRKQAEKEINYITTTLQEIADKEATRPVSIAQINGIAGFLELLFLYISSLHKHLDELEKQKNR